MTTATICRQEPTLAVYPDSLPNSHLHKPNGPFSGVICFGKTVRLEVCPIHGKPSPYISTPKHCPECAVVAI